MLGKPPAFIINRKPSTELTKSGSLSTLPEFIESLSELNKQQSSTQLTSDERSFEHSKKNPLPLRLRESKRLEKNHLQISSGHVRPHNF
jgi:hypothetical protein